MPPPEIIFHVMIYCESETRSELKLVNPIWAEIIKNNSAKLPKKKIEKALVLNFGAKGPGIWQLGDKPYDVVTKMGELEKFNLQDHYFNHLYVNVTPKTINTLIKWAEKENPTIVAEEVSYITMPWDNCLYSKSPRLIDELIMAKKIFIMHGFRDMDEICLLEDPSAIHSVYAQSIDVYFSVRDEGNVQLDGYLVKQIVDFLCDNTAPPKRNRKSVKFSSKWPMENLGPALCQKLATGRQPEKFFEHITIETTVDWPSDLLESLSYVEKVGTDVFPNSVEQIRAKTNNNFNWGFTIYQMKRADDWRIDILVGKEGGEAGFMCGSWWFVLHKSV